jgi:hypothetical protein
LNFNVYIKSIYNKIDLALALFSFIEFIITNNFGFVTSLRALRLLKIVTLEQKNDRYDSFEFLILALYKSLPALINMFILMVFYISFKFIIFAIYILKGWIYIYFCYYGFKVIYIERNRS